MPAEVGLVAEFVLPGGSARARVLPEPAHFGKLAGDVRQIIDGISDVELCRADVGSIGASL